MLRWCCVISRSPSLLAKSGAGRAVGIGQEHTRQAVARPLYPNCIANTYPTEAWLCGNTATMCYPKSLSRRFTNEYITAPSPYLHTADHAHRNTADPLVAIRPA